MKSWKKYLTLGVVALLLVGAVYMNVKLGEQGSTGGVLAPTDGGAETADGLGIESAGTNADYFENFRQDRDSMNDKELGWLDEVIATSASDAETLADAQAQKLALIESIEKEFTMESLLKAKGFEDVAVMYRPGSVSVVVKQAVLEPEQVAKIVDVVKGETGEPAGNITIIPNG